MPLSSRATENGDGPQNAAGRLDERESVALRRAVLSSRGRVSRAIKSSKGKAVAYADNVVPAELRRLLERELDVMAERPDADFQPGSQGRVQNLINPSMYPYIRGTSHLRDRGAGFEVASPDSPAPGSSWTYQCLPSQIFVDAEGDATIRSYVNNVDRESTGDLYNTMELLFALFVPMFESVLKKKLRSRELQVIVKAVNYVIQPEGRSYEGGWHMEGMEHEHIVAAGMYYYSTSPCLQDVGLKFRPMSSPPPTTTTTANSDRLRLLVETVEVMRMLRTSTREIRRYVRSRPARQPTPGDEIMRFDGVDARRMRYQPADARAPGEFVIPTRENRLLVFANEIRHKVGSLVNTGASTGVRKTFMFFLVDPGATIVSTRDVPAQQWERVRLRQAAALRAASGLPDEILSNIVARAKSGFTSAEARAHRLRFLRERMVFVDDDSADDDDGALDG
ncbi:hypothetical protein MPTK1_6g01800 [Marchantia polymorpha subsp. ruderalis]|uniref:DUF4246 domain-containing protein n=2 Tax=Marchantia polymorpha TaxID=3197 RepID=A0AAF6BMJ0_MARPO|nr:hypothetical protein MARPO_0052s0024 [Marchantia polymorpha]BBN13224.1 hypothetical protein Mp_6g01800 [Marchantia polymorpha subsp. ruderalis]|eukprot:PTQ38221.1 hypothetical protein MARPO_0052s0024 [Marchantia polymorpha]